jgi:hypothetical protein
MNRFPDEDPNAKPRSSMIGDKGTPRDQACKKTYEMPDGVLYIPGPNIYSGLIEAGKFHKVGKRQVTTLKSSLIPSGIFLLDPECPLFDPQTKEKMTAWDVEHAVGRLVGLLAGLVAGRTLVSDHRRSRLRVGVFVREAVHQKGRYA